MASIETKVDALTNDVFTLKSTFRQPESQSVALYSAAPENPHSTVQLFDQQIRIDGIHESKGEYVAQTESDDAQITAFPQHLGEDQAPISISKRIGPFDAKSTRTRTMIVEFPSVWIARKILSKGHLLKTFDKPIFFFKIAKSD